MNKQIDASTLSTAVESKSRFRSGVLDLLPCSEKEAGGEVFQALQADANRELASLLRDVHTGSHTALAGGGQSQQIAELLMRAIRCATKQFMLQAELGNLALTDELTGLYNRRGFISLADRQLKLGRRARREMMLFFIDVDGLKQINDSFGHSEGDAALRHTAETLEKTFRDSDVVARLGGDEFAVLAIEASGHSEVTIRARLGEYLKIINTKEPRYAISLSIGVARFDHRKRTSITELMAQADQVMYEQKPGPSRSRITARASYQC